MRRTTIAIMAAAAALLSQPALAQAPAAAPKAPPPAAKPTDRDVFCFVATASSATALRQNEAKLSEQDKKAIPALTQAVPFFASRVTKRLSGDPLVKALRVADNEFKGTNRGAEAMGCLNAFGTDMKAIVEASKAAAAAQK